MDQSSNYAPESLSVPKPDRLILFKKIAGFFKGIASKLNVTHNKYILAGVACLVVFAIIAFIVLPGPSEPKVPTPSSGGTPSQYVLSGNGGFVGTFYLGSEKHMIKVERVGIGSADFEVESEPVKFTVNLGNSKRVDITKDSVDDIEVAVSKIYKQVVTFSVKTQLGTPAAKGTTKSGSTGAVDRGSTRPAPSGPDYSSAPSGFQGPTPEPVVLDECIDTDINAGNLRFNIPATCSDKASFKADTCVSDTNKWFLEEYKCDAGKCVVEKVECPAECKSDTDEIGYCVPICKDSDATLANPDGKNYFKAGNVSLGGASKKDECDSSGKLVEKVCGKKGEDYVILEDTISCADKSAGSVCATDSATGDAYCTCLLGEEVRFDVSSNTGGVISGNAYKYSKCSNEPVSAALQTKCSDLDLNSALPKDVPSRVDIEAKTNGNFEVVYSLYDVCDSGSILEAFCNNDGKAAYKPSEQCSAGRTCKLINNVAAYCGCDNFDSYELVNGGANKVDGCTGIKTPMDSASFAMCSKNQGLIAVDVGNAMIASGQDFCRDDNTLVEWYCDGKVPRQNNPRDCGAGFECVVNEVTGAGECTEIADCDECDAVDQERCVDGDNKKIQTCESVDGCLKWGAIANCELDANGRETVCAPAEADGFITAVCAPSSVPCAVDEDCEVGLMCTEGICVPRPANECATDENCEPGEKCESGVCTRAEACVADEDCLNYCSDDAYTLNSEGTCVNGVCQYLSGTGCDGGCENGVCKQITECADTDGGKVYETRGETSGKTLEDPTVLDTRGDYCSDEDTDGIDETLYEVYCGQDEEVLEEQYVCQNDCENGACKPEPDCDLTFFQDFDGDNYGSDQTVQACAPPENYVSVSGDCNDNDENIKPDAEEICDGADNNCDGNVDSEGGIVLTQYCYAGPEETDNVGLCRGGIRTCASGQWSDSCEGSVIPAQEVCDAETKDENCDGSANEYCDCVSGETKACGSDTGSCAKGTQTCGDDGRWGEECAGQTLPSEELCDGADNDCDGIVDDNLSPPLCDLVAGVCAGKTKLCGESSWLSCAAINYGEEYQTIEDACDGLDNDCDGDVDEGCQCSPPGAARQCGLNTGECKQGAETCSNGLWGECLGAINPREETCDGKDNDCDGSVDEVFTDKGQECIAGIGACQRIGTFVCKSDGSGTECSASDEAEACQVCQPNQKQCNGDKIEQCKSDGSGWAAIQTCPAGCENGACKEVLQCSDSDGGKIPEVPGQTESDGYIKRDMDACGYGNVVIETYCDSNGNIAKETIPCPGGTLCSLSDDHLGFCKQVQQCSDSDGGLTYDMPGSTQGIYGGGMMSQTDSCIDSHVMIEYYCYSDGISLRTKSYYCPIGYTCQTVTVGGVVGGACKPSPEPVQDMYAGQEAACVGGKLRIGDNLYSCSGQKSYCEANAKGCCEYPGRPVNCVQPTQEQLYTKTKCVGNKLYWDLTCLTASGSSNCLSNPATLVRDCAPNECIDGACIGNQQICTPNAAQCEGGSLKVCLQDGSEWSYSDCGGYGCENGACKTPPACIDECSVFDEPQCIDSDGDGSLDSTHTCSIDAETNCKVWSELVSCAHGCDSETGSCNPDPCDGVVCPDQCNGDIKQTNGQCVSGECTYSEEQCLHGCQDGICLFPPVQWCDPSSTRCSPDPSHQNYAEQCNADGSGWELTNSCGSEATCMYENNGAICRPNWACSNPALNNCQDIDCGSYYVQGSVRGQVDMCSGIYLVESSCYAPESDPLVMGTGYIPGVRYEIYYRCPYGCYAGACRPEKYCTNVQGGGVFYSVTQIPVWYGVSYSCPGSSPWCVPWVGAKCCQQAYNALTDDYEYFNCVNPVGVPVSQTGSVVLATPSNQNVLSQLAIIFYFF